MPRLRDTRRLVLFDFDGTLFRSPDPPPEWKDKEAWGDAEASLSAFVPRVPDSRWWNPPVVLAARMAISDPHCWAAFATGRRRDVFQNRVLELLSQRGLSFNSEHLRPPNLDTLRFKTKLLLWLTERTPNLRVLEVWDDRLPHLEVFRDALKSPGVTVFCHHVVADPMPPTESR